MILWRVNKFFLPAFSVALLFFLTSCRENKPVKKGEAEVVIPVRVMSVASADDAGLKNYVGTVSASKSAFVSAQYPGKLVSLNVKSGDEVEAGQVIAEIDSPTVKTAAEMAHSTLEQAEDGYARLQKVYASGSVADVKMVEIQTQLAKARSSAAAADKALEDCKIKAPFAGVVSEVFAEEGVQLNPLDNIVRLMDISTISISFPVPENEISAIKTGASVYVSVPALGGGNLPAKVVSKGVTASLLSHSYQCKAEPESPVAGLMPGMVTKVYFADESRSRIVVPAAVIRTDADGRYVWTVRDNVVRKTYIEPGGFYADGVIVSSGLAVGDLVICEGFQKVSTGMKVEVK